MAFNTGNTVPSTSAKDLSDNAENFDSATNSNEITWTDRLGVTKDTLQGRLNKLGVIFDDPIRDWSAALLVSDLRAHRYPATTGDIYIPVKPLPFTTGATFNGSDWEVFQGLNNQVLIDDLSQAYEFGTVQLMITSSKVLPVGKALTTSFYNTTIKTNWIIEAVSNPSKWSLALVGGGFAVLNEAINDIRHYGGADDWNGSAGTNNKEAIDYLLNLRPVTIKLPLSGTGIYLYNGEISNTDLAGVFIEADDGISFHHIETASQVVFYSQNIKFSSNFSVYKARSRARYELGNQSYKAPSELTSFMSIKDGFAATPKSISTDEIINYTLTSWPNGSLVPSTPSSISSTEILYNPQPAASFAYAVSPATIGDQLSCNIVGAGKRGIAIRTVGGWAQAYINNGELVTTIKDTSLGTNSVSTTKDETILFGEEYKTTPLITVTMISNRSAILAANGVSIGRIDTPSNIIEMGFVTGFGAGLGAFNYFSIYKGKYTNGAKQLKITTVGDSTSAESLPPSQVNFMKQFLTGFGGCQIEQLQNVSVSGATSTDQLSVLLTTNIASHDYCLIQIGVNDIQTGTAVSTLVSNIKSMVDYCRTNSTTPIVGLPTSWYSQAAAQVYNQDGGATNAGNNNGRYNAQLLNEIGDYGVIVNKGVVEDMGAVLASLITSGNDKMVSDNLHPSTLGQMMMGYSFAKSIVGHLTSAENFNIDTSSPLEWWNGTPSSTPRYSSTENRFEFSWYLGTGGLTLTDGSIIGTIPARFRPNSNHTLVHLTAVNASIIPAGTQGAIASVSQDTGEVKIYNADVSASFFGFTGGWSI